MAGHSLCRVDGCDRPRVQGTFVCESHLGEKRRCEGVVHEVDPETGEVLKTRRCKKAARPGNVYCHHHGGSGEKGDLAANRASAMTAMQRFVKPYEGDIDPVSAFEMEFRRTYGRILWLEEQIGSLESEQDLIWGITKEEDVSATEFAGVNRTYEARIHVFEDMLRWERKHFLELEKVWIRANLDERKLSMMRSQIDYTYTLVVRCAQMLGHDPADPSVRDIIGRLFENEARAIEARLEE